MATLRILVSDAWPDRAEAPWVVLDKGSVVASGNSGPSNWPRADRIEAILTGTQLGWTQVKLPMTRPREQLRALPFAIEEQLLREPDSQHFTPVYSEEEDWSVLVIARERMRRLIAQFKALDRPLDAAYSALACLPVTADSWTLAVDGQYCLVRSSPAHAIVDDIEPGSTELPPILATMLMQAHAQGRMPAQVLAYAADDALVAALQKHNVAVVHENLWPWHVVSSGAANLMHDEFLPAHARGRLLRTIRPAIIFLVVVLLLDLVVGTGSALMRQHELKEVRTRMQQLAQTQLPGRALQDPVLQLHRELQTQRRQHGLMAEDDLLALLGEFAQALGSDATNALQGIHYENGALIVTLAKPLDMNALQSRLDVRGIAATPRGGTTLALQRKQP